MATDELRSKCLDGACWHCSRFAGFVGGGAHALCDGPGARVHASPATGCVYFTREPGVDDEPGPPAGFTGDDGAGWRTMVAVNETANLYRVGRHPLLEGAG